MPQALFCPKPPILFLDFDGVLHPDVVYRERGRIVLKRDGGTLLEWAPFIEEALAPYPQVRIVLSTSWVRVLSFDEAKERLPPALQARVIGTTCPGQTTPQPEDSYASPYARTPRTPRAEQVLGYAIRHGLIDWLALDDDTREWPDELRHRPIATDGGLVRLQANGPNTNRCHGL